MSITLRAPRLAWLLVLLLGTAAACGDDDDDDDPAGHHDAGPHTVKDAGAKPVPASKLPRHTLPRPPHSGLPADLRPPR